MTASRRLFWLPLLLLVACKQREPPVSDGDFTPCGNVSCRSFDSPLAALNEVLRRKPSILAIGESHPQRARAQVEATARRFGRELLPELVQRGARQLVVELLLPSAGCEPEVKKVRGVERPVLAEQAPTNQEDYTWLGQRARELGIVPYVLEPSCAEYAAVTARAADPLFELMRLVANEAGEKLARFAAQNQAAAPGVPSGFVLAYGGALHNDAAPRPERAAWSFGPRLTRESKGRYVELDLVVPEYVVDNDAWRAQPWYPHFASSTQHGAVVLYRMGPESFALVFATDGG